MNKTKIIGIVRYSILTENTTKKSWHISKKLSFSDLEKALFDPDRLKQRALLFSKITLPSLDANQRDWADFRVLVVCSEKLPEWHMVDLENSCKAYPFVTIKKIGTQVGALGEALNDYIQKEVGETETYFTYRIDDDDALSIDYTDIIKPYVIEAYTGIVLSLPLGYSGYYNTKKQSITIYGETYVAMTALGLGLVANKKSKHKHVFNLRAGSHRKTDRAVPVLLLSETHAYFRTLHEHASMYWGRSSLESTKRTFGKISKTVPLDEILSRINVNRSLFTEQSVKLSGQKKSILSKIYKAFDYLLH